MTTIVITRRTRNGVCVCVCEETKAKALADVAGSLMTVMTDVVKRS